MTAASSAPRKAGGVGYAGCLYLGPTVQPAAAANSARANAIALARLSQTEELLMHGLLSGPAAGGEPQGNWIQVRFRVHRRSFPTAYEAMRKVLDHREGHGNKDETDGCRKKHPSDHHRAQNAPRGATRARGYPEWKATEDESQGRHHDGSKTKPGGGQRGL